MWLGCDGGVGGGVYVVLVDWVLVSVVVVCVSCMLSVAVSVFLFVDSLFDVVWLCCVMCDVLYGVLLVCVVLRVDLVYGILMIIIL